MSLTIRPYEGQGWTDDSAPDLSAETLNAVDAGITANSNAINAIANAVVSQIVNDPDKIASIAVAYALEQKIEQLNSNLVLKANSSDLLKVKIVSYSVSCGTSQSGTTMPYRSDGVDLTAKSDYPAGTKLIIPIAAYSGTKYGIMAITSNRYLNLNGDNLTYTCAVAYLYTD